MPRERAAAVLGVRIDASREQIDEAFRRAIRAHHPDAGGSGDRTLEVIAARDALIARPDGVNTPARNRTRRFVRHRHRFWRW